MIVRNTHSGATAPPPEKKHSNSSRRCSSGNYNNNGTSTKTDGTSEFDRKNALEGIRNVQSKARYCNPSPPALSLKAGAHLCPYLYEVVDDDNILPRGVPILNRDLTDVTTSYLLFPGSKAARVVWCGVCSNSSLVLVI